MSPDSEANSSDVRRRGGAEINAEHASSIDLNPREMRALGYRMVDEIVEHWTTLRERPVAHSADLGSFESILAEPLPLAGTPVGGVIDLLKRDVLKHISHVDHPRFFGFIPSPNNFVSVMADALAAGTNVFSGSWISGAGAAAVESVTIDWLRQLCGLPDSAGGMFVSGGSMANLTALAAARHIRAGDRLEHATVYFSDQTHSSVERALRIIGISEQRFRKIPTVASYRLDVGSLREAVVRDRATGLEPLCVVANAGTTNTGSVDPLDAIADFCEAEGLWLHVDGAYGAAAVLTDRGRTLLRGLERADSIALDPHKWLFQPYEIGCVLVKHAEWLTQAFRILPEYLEDTRRERTAINYCDRGIQLTRSFRALKLWMSLKTFGINAFRDAIDRGFDLADVAQREMEARDHWEIVTPSRLAIVTFRFAPPHTTEQERGELNRSIASALSESGYAFISTTALDGRIVLRFCTINPRTTDDELRETVARIDAIASRL